MTDSIDNLLLEHLKAIRADIGTIKADLKENTTRLGRIEVAVAGLRRDIAHNEEATAEQSLRIDRINERIERIERRLEIA
jgi:chromosome segregation ATPase